MIYVSSKSQSRSFSLDLFMFGAEPSPGSLH